MKIKFIYERLNFQLLYEFPENAIRVNDMIVFTFAPSLHFMVTAISYDLATVTLGNEIRTRHIRLPLPESVSPMEIKVLYQDSCGYVLEESQQPIFNFNRGSEFISIPTKEMSPTITHRTINNTWVIDPMGTRAFCYISQLISTEVDDPTILSSPASSGISDSFSAQRFPSEMSPTPTPSSGISDSFSAQCSSSGMLSTPASSRRVPNVLSPETLGHYEYGWLARPRAELPMDSVSPPSQVRSRTLLDRVTHLSPLRPFRRARAAIPGYIRILPEAAAAEVIAGVQWAAYGIVNRIAQASEAAAMTTQAAAHGVTNQMAQAARRAQNRLLTHPFYGVYNPRTPIEQDEFSLRHGDIAPLLGPSVQSNPNFRGM